MMYRDIIGCSRRRIAAGHLVMLLAVVLVSLPGGAFDLEEIGLRVSIDRLATATSATGAWHASVRGYVRTALDSVWCMDTGLGFDFVERAVFGTIGFRRDVLKNLVVEGDVTLQWIPRRGVTGAIDAGICYAPQISERGQLILETFPVHWQLISVDHRYIPVPELHLAFTVGANLLLDQGGFFGEAITVEGYKIEHRRLPFSLFVGNGWYLTMAQFTTRVGYGQ